MPFYDYCESNNIPVLLAFGELNYRAIRHMTIEALDNVLEMFPKMKTTVFHGGWPYTNEICWVAFNHDNLYISPDYTMLPTFGGHQDFINYENGNIVAFTVIVKGQYTFILQRHWLRSHTRFH